MSDASANRGEAPRKRKRLTHACTGCRARKVRCDERLPKCSNCVKAGTECVTFDPRRPNTVVERREAQRPYQSPSSTAATPPAHQDRPSPHDSAARNRIQPAIILDGESSNQRHANTPQPSRTQELLPTLPRFTGGSSLYILTQWLDLAFARLGIPQRFSNQYGRERLPVHATVPPNKHGEDPSADLTDAEMEANIKSFMDSVNITFPIFNDLSIRRLLQDWQHYRTVGRDAQGDQRVDSLLMALVFAVPHSISAAQLSTHCLYYALSQLHVLVEDSSIRSIQALFLMALILRCRDEIELSSQMINLAASVAQTLGLHRQVSRRQHMDMGEQRVQEYICIWWAIYALEKIISFELGRLSVIRDFECNQSMPTQTRLAHSDTQSGIFPALIELAKIQSEANEQLALSRHMEEESSDLRPAIRSKIEIVGELDQKLLSWTQTLPPHVRLENCAFCEPDIFPAVSFLTVQYWQTQLLLHRNALLINSQVIKTELDIHFADKPFRFRLRSGQNICCSAARSIVSTLNHVYENDACSVLNSSHAPLIAVYVLAIYIIKNPHSGLSKADFELQANAIRIIATHQDYIGKLNHPSSKALRELLDSLHSHVAVRLGGSLLAANANKHNSTRTSRDSSVIGFPDESSTLPLPSLVPTMSPAAARRALDDGMNTLPFIHGSQSLTFGNPDIDFSLEVLDDMDIDWDALALAYDLPS